MGNGRQAPDRPSEKRVGKELLWNRTGGEAFAGTARRLRGHRWVKGSAPVNGRLQRRQSRCMERLGASRPFTAVVDQFVRAMPPDGRISNRFASADIPRLKGISSIRCT